MHSAIDAGATVPEVVVVEAARCWRSARDAKRPVQPSLYALLAPYGYEMLAPVFDSLMTLCECCFRRVLCTGDSLAPTSDERMLCRLLSDPSELDRLTVCGWRAQGGDAMAKTFACALNSARIMISLTIIPPEISGAQNSTYNGGQSQ